MRRACRAPGCERSDARDSPHRAAMPIHTDAHSVCETGSMLSSAIFENGSGRICSAIPLAVSRWPSLQVPRMPSVSHEPRGSSANVSRGATISTWSDGGASG